MTMCMRTSDLYESVKEDISSAGYSDEIVEYIFSRIENLGEDLLLSIHKCFTAIRLSEVTATFTDRYICIILGKKYYFDISKTSEVSDMKMLYFKNTLVIYSMSTFLVVHNEVVHNIMGVWVSVNKDVAQRNLLLSDNAETETWMGGMCYRFR